MEIQLTTMDDKNLDGKWRKKWVDTRIFGKVANWDLAFRLDRCRIRSESKNENPMNDESTWTYLNLKYLLGKC